MKMYILVKESLSAGHVALACAHASLSCYLQFQDKWEMQEWVGTSFKKCVCVVTDKEFEKFKEYPSRVVMTESSLGNAETAIVFCPRYEYPKAFKFLKLYKGPNMVFDIETIKGVL